MEITHAKNDLPIESETKLKLYNNYVNISQADRFVTNTYLTSIIWRVCSR